jgi:hypothetical protein
VLKTGKINLSSEAQTKGRLTMVSSEEIPFPIIGMGIISLVFIVGAMFWGLHNQASANDVAQATLNSELGTHQFVIGQDVIQATNTQNEVKYSGIKNGQISLTEINTESSLLTSSSNSIPYYIPARQGSNAVVDSNILVTVNSVNKNSSSVMLTISKE